MDYQKETDPLIGHGASQPKKNYNSIGINLSAYSKYSTDILTSRQEAALRPKGKSIFH